MSELHTVNKSAYVIKTTALKKLIQVMFCTFCIIFIKEMFQSYFRTNLIAWLMFFLQCLTLVLEEKLGCEICNNHVQ